MVFTSFYFLFLFLPLLVILYYLIDKKYANFLLLAFSLFFYFKGDNSFILLLLSLSFMTYIFGLLIETFKNNKANKFILIIYLIIVIFCLISYKYSDFIIENLKTFIKINSIESVLPLGISFFTFQMISYIVDVYSGEKAIHNIIDLFLYICFFPQLIAGPIVRFKDVKKYLSVKYRTFKFDNLSLGLWRFSIGLCKKVLIANNLATLTYIAFNRNAPNSILMAWLGAVSFTLQIYYDFSGYSDMAIGLSKIFGFEIKENFNYPFFAKNIKDFWRRWHISLSSFFRDYVYIPMGGNRCSKYRHIFNLLFIWFLTGLWHGAAWHYILWGVLYGIFIIIEELLPKFSNKLILLIQRFITLIIVIIMFVIFNSTDLDFAFKYILNMFGIGDSGLIDYAFKFQLLNYGLLLFVAAIFSLPIIPKLEVKFKDNTIYSCINSIVLIIGVIFSVATIYMNGYNPFLYFNF